VSAFYRETFHSEGFRKTSTIHFVVSDTSRPARARSPEEKGQRRDDPGTPEEVADVLAASTRGHEALRRLLIMLGAVLSRNEHYELTLKFGREVRQMLQGVVERLPFKPEVTLRLLMHAYALAVGWQHVTEENLTTDYVRRQRDLAFLAPRFETEFAFSLRAVIDRLVAQE
jgi:hypothetical protein